MNLSQFLTRTPDKYVQIRMAFSILVKEWMQLVGDCFQTTEYNESMTLHIRQVCNAHALLKWISLGLQVIMASQASSCYSLVI